MKADGASLASLMARAQEGDAVAYRAVLDECRRWLLRYFAGRVAPAHVDDLIQDTLVSVHNKRGTYDPARPFLPWLAAIARYRWVDLLRQSYRAAKSDANDCADDHDVEAEVVSRISIDRMLARLSSAQESAIRLVKIEGFSITEAAIHTGQSETLVKVNIHRGLKRLAEHIGSE